jgi:5-methylcytosine-specific restriction protein B
MNSTPFVSTSQFSSPCWFVGALTAGRDLTDQFIDEGVWYHGFEDDGKIQSQVRSMQAGERIAIKSAYTRKKDLPFDNRGNSTSVMAIKAIGDIAENMGDGKRLRVNWQRVSPNREWYFYTYQRAIWKVNPGDWKTDALIEFSFNNKPQDIDRFCDSPIGVNGLRPTQKI